MMSRRAHGGDAIIRFTLYNVFYSRDDDGNLIEVRENAADEIRRLAEMLYYLPELEGVRTAAEAEIERRKLAPVVEEDETMEFDDDEEFSDDDEEFDDEDEEEFEEFDDEDDDE